MSEEQTMVQEKQRVSPVLDDIQVLSQKCDLSVTFLRRELKRNPDFPRIKVGRVFRFDFNDVLLYLKSKNGKEQR